MSKLIRYELKIEGAKGFLAPLSFPVAEAALGFIFAERPKYLTAGAILVKSLWVKGSKSLQEGGENFDAACLQAYSILNSLVYEYKDNEVTIDYFSTDKEGNKTPKKYKFKLKSDVNRDTLEECLGLTMPNAGNPKPLTAGLRILDENWDGGDEEIREVDEMKIIACLVCYNLIKFKSGQIKKV